MTKIYVDDSREVPENILGYNSFRTYEDCVLFLSLISQVDVMNLDYDLGTEKTGLDILKFTKEHNVKVGTFIIHSDHKAGVREMMKYIEKNFPGVSCHHRPQKGKEK